MRPRFTSVLLLVLALGVTFLAGFGLGTHRTHRWMVRSLANETQGNLSRHLETLARLRFHDDDGLRLLEAAVDSALETLPRYQGEADLAPDILRALQMGRAYRSAYPSAQLSPRAWAFLESVPMPDADQCSPAMRRVLQQARELGRQ